MITPVLLSGGVGSRLWPISTPESPKQLLRISGDESLLQAAALRVMGMEEAFPPVMITSHSLGPRMIEHLEEIGCAPAAVLTEPVGRNTAPAAMAAALWADPDDLLLGLPTDHLVTDVEAFRAAIRQGIPPAERGELVIFGIEPSHPHPGLGYMEVGAGRGIRQVRRFVEKPGIETARQMVDSGHYLWNGGMFLARAAVLREVIARLLPGVARTVTEAFVTAMDTGDGTLRLGDRFEEAPSVSVAKGLWERAGRILAVPMDAGWSDIGSWEALGEALGRDDLGNVVSGTGVVEAGKGVQVHARGAKTAVVGVSDVVVAVANGRVLVASREMWEQAGETIERLESLF
ncbi:MAG: sugar phosphate nucleotidyltransferase [bacterium]|nr:sugar phosphate nucleotidyltransferase [bacterium]MDE0601271.1 sugar phosphate nucleotidyltransferase [bacterium]